MEQKFFAHATADVSPRAEVGDGTKIWQQCQVRENVVIGCNCILGKGVYVDAGVKLGNNIKLENGVSVYLGVTLEDGVFCGPNCIFTNDHQPRATTLDGALRGVDDWIVTQSLVKTGATLGANATIVCGVTIGRWAMVGAGAVVTHDVPDYGLVYGNPARLHDFVCACGEKLILGWVDNAKLDPHPLLCPRCQTITHIPASVYEQMLKTKRGVANNFSPNAGDWQPP